MYSLAIFVFTLALFVTNGFIVENWSVQPCNLQKQGGRFDIFVLLNELHKWISLLLNHTTCLKKTVIIYFFYFLSKSDLYLSINL